VLRRLAALAVLFAVPALSADALDGRLEKIQKAKAITIAYRTDALPFSYEADGQPAGYTVELCKRVVASLELQLGVSPINVKWVPATSQNRLDMVRTGKADLECGSTSATLSRMEQVDFSSPVFVDTTALLARKDAGARALAGFAGKRIAVVAGTTNQQALDKAVKKALLSVTVVPVKDRAEGVAALEGGNADAFAGDRILLAGLAGKVKDPSQFELLEEDLAIEPYAIVLPRGDANFRLAINRALSRIYDSEAIVEIFRRAFGAQTRPSPALVLMYGINTYAE